jgi:hypothetical protein
LRDSRRAALLLSAEDMHSYATMNPATDLLRSLCLRAAGCALVLAVLSAPALAQTDRGIEQALERCGAIGDNAQRLACFDAVRAQVGSKPNAPVTPAQQMQPARPSISSHAVGETRRNQPIVARIDRFVLDRRGKFTVYLDNGQVWRQLESGGNQAQFRSNGMNVATISPGFWGSYNLRLNRESAIYKVKRISP